MKAGQEAAMTTSGDGQPHSLQAEGLVDFYAERGFAGHVGFGERPALLVIDMARAWTMPFPASPMGSDLSGVLEQIHRLLAVARGIPIPVYFTTMEFEPDGRDLGDRVAKKIPQMRFFRKGSEWTQLDPSLQVQ